MFGYYDSPIGIIKIVGNETHITNLDFVEEISSMKDDKNEIILSCINQLDEYFKGKRKVFNICISQPETDFQNLVWNEINNIPYGETRTYSQIAENINRSKSYRAVGTACGRNKIAIILPCHRIVAKAGLGGYAFGMERKQKLLEIENKYN